jgi:hypothetical protein
VITGGFGVLGWLGRRVRRHGRRHQYAGYWGALALEEWFGGLGWHAGLQGRRPGGIDEVLGDGGGWVRLGAATRRVVCHLGGAGAVDGEAGVAELDGGRARLHGGLGQLEAVGKSLFDYVLHGGCGWSRLFLFVLDWSAESHRHFKRISLVLQKAMELDFCILCLRSVRTFDCTSLRSQIWLQ